MKTLCVLLLALGMGQNGLPSHSCWSDGFKATENVTTIWCGEAIICVGNFCRAEVPFISAELPDKIGTTHYFQWGKGPDHSHDEPMIVDSGPISISRGQVVTTSGSVLDAPEPIDVPAIQETRKRRDCLIADQGCLVYGDETTYLAWTCADKARILQTAENGDHWCHRVQP
jgi:hypothetical protein